MLNRLSALLNIFIILMIVIVALTSCVVWLYQKEGPTSEDTVLQIPKGSGLNQISGMLEDQGLIDEELLFRTIAIYRGVGGQVRYGEFLIPANASLKEIMDILVEGRAIQQTVTFPEGWTSFAMVQRLNSVEKLEGQVTVIPDEGSLAPNTYAYLRGAHRDTIIETMQSEQKRILDHAWEGRDPELPLKTKRELLILASLIERETGTPEERGLVASVFANRLKKGMKLQTDPAVIYGITGGERSLGRGLLRSELDRETPYNTYIIEGLPPTPICNPGKASIEAAANPVKSDYLFFVAKTTNPSDGHNFSETLDEHNTNVEKYREAERADAQN